MSYDLPSDDYRYDPQDGFDMTQEEYEGDFDSFGMDDEYDGQPSEYDEWQDYMGGDDNPWDAGEYDGDY